MKQSKNKAEKLSIFALGGVGEIGKNMYVIQYGSDIVVIDSGLKFPEEDMLGVDIVIPDISYLVDNQEHVKRIETLERSGVRNEADTGTCRE